MRRPPRARALACAWVLLAAAAPGLEAQRRPPSRFTAAESATAPFALPKALAQPAEDRTGPMAIGALLGGGAGLYAGAAIGYLVDRSLTDECYDICGLAGAVYGAWIGESLGLATGVHLGNLRRGSLPADMGAALVIGGLGTIAVLTTLGDDNFVLVAVPIAQLIGTIIVERKVAEVRER